MKYKAKVVVCFEISVRKKNTQYTASTIYNFWLLNLVVRKETAKL